LRSEETRAESKRFGSCPGRECQVAVRLGTYDPSSRTCAFSNPHCGLAGDHVPTDELRHRHRPWLSRSRRQRMTTRSPASRGMLGCCTSKQTKAWHQHSPQRAASVAAPMAKAAFLLLPGRGARLEALASPRSRSARRSNDAPPSVQRPRDQPIHLPSAHPPRDGLLSWDGGLTWECLSGLEALDLMVRAHN